MLIAVHRWIVGRLITIPKTDFKKWTRKTKAAAATAWGISYGQSHIKKESGARSRSDTRWRAIYIKGRRNIIQKHLSGVKHAVSRSGGLHVGLCIEGHRVGSRPAKEQVPGALADGRLKRSEVTCSFPNERNGEGLGLSCQTGSVQVSLWNR